MKKPYFLFVLLLPLFAGCYKGKCYMCRKYAPASTGNGTVYVGDQKVCPEKDKINLVDPVPGDSTDLWECDKKPLGGIW